MFAAALLLSGCAMASSPPANVTPLDHLPSLAGSYFPIHSAATGSSYHIYVRLPVGYVDQPKRRYPVVYLLDGDSLFPILAANHLFLTYDDKLPEAIVVGIAYGSFASPQNRRSFDFTPPSADPKKGGAPAFQRFLKDELIPKVEQRTHADPTRRILFGQSRGGAFVLYSAFTDPDLFWGRIASNPTIDSPMFSGTPARSARSDLQLVVASGTRDRPQLHEATVAWLSSWERRNDAPWTLKPITIAGGTHSADAQSAYRAGMAWLFRDVVRN